MQNSKSTLLIASGGLLLGVISLVMSFVAISRDPLSAFGKPLSSYDLSEPFSGLKSSLEIEKDANLRAAMELEQTKRKGKADEKLRTIAVEKELDHDGRKLLFVKFTESEVPKYEVIAMTKDATSGLWTKEYVGEYSLPEGPIRDAFVRWNATGKF